MDVFKMIVLKTVYSVLFEIVRILSSGDQKMKKKASSFLSKIT